MTRLPNTAGPLPQARIELHWFLSRQRIKHNAKIASSWAATLLGIAVGGAVSTAQPANSLPGYDAVYAVHERGRAVGEAEFSVTLVEAGSGTYQFRSETRFRGLYRLIVPRPVEETSEFVIENGRIRPLAYSLRDGTRQGRNGYRLEFDWAAGRAVTMSDVSIVATETVPGVQDRGSLQVALMLLDDDFAKKRVTLLDKDGPEIHELRAAGEETLDTPLGRIGTRKVIQQRVGSSRRTLVWLAPDLHGLPVRIERQNDGETRAALQLEDVRWHE